MITRVLTTCGGAGIVSIVEASNIVAGSKATSNAQWAKCDLKCDWKAKNESTDGSGGDTIATIASEKMASSRSVLRLIILIIINSYYI